VLERPRGRPNGERLFEGTCVPVSCLVRDSDRARAAPRGAWCAAALAHGCFHTPDMKILFDQRVPAPLSGSGSGVLASDRRSRLPCHRPPPALIRGADGLQFRLCRVRTSGAFVARAAPPRPARGGTLQDAKGPRRSAGWRRRRAGKADVLVDDNRYRARPLPHARRRRPMLSGPLFDSQIVSQGTRGSAHFSVAAPSRATRSCYDRASRTIPIVAATGSRRRATRSRPLAVSPAHRTPVHSTAVRPQSGRPA
jgi:hypothetical protein